MSLEITNTIRSKSIIKIVGNTSTSVELSDLSANANNEMIQAASITYVACSSDGKWVVRRGGAAGNVSLALFGENLIPFTQADISLSNENTLNLHFTNTGTDGTMIMEVSKRATYNVAPDLL